MGEGYFWRRRAIADSIVKQPLLFRHASSPLLFAARGRRRLLHSRPPVRGRAERRVPDAPLGLMPMRSSAIDASGLSESPGSTRRSARGVFRLACLHCAMVNDPITKITGPGRWAREPQATGPDSSDEVVRRAGYEVCPSANDPALLSQWYPDHRTAVPLVGGPHPKPARRRISSVHRIPPRNRDDRARPSRWGRTCGT
jgi:hypothetical protein